ncbi:MAG: acyltransferase [Hyphomicrobium sp.]|nr:acyltransferase [Hyphomicrobium sp.]
MRVKSLDGLRGLAALLVVVSHFAELAGVKVLGSGAAQIGVMIFFALSGYLMGHLYFSAPPTIDNVARFFQRRTARVLPLYYLLVLSSLAVTLVAVHWHYWIYPLKLDAALLHLIPIHGTSVLWTIPVEIHFYLLFPVIWWLRHRVPGGALFLLCGLVAFGLYVHTFNTPDTSIKALTMVVHYFAAGLILACFAHSASRRWNLVFVASFAALPLFYPAIGHLVPTPLADGVTLRQTAQAMWGSPLYLGMVALLLLATIRSPLAAKVLGSTPFSLLGSISYSLYLLHMPVFWYFNRFTPLGKDPAVFALFAMPAALVVAWVSYRLIECPARAYINSRELPEFGPAPETTPAGTAVAR